MNRDRFDATGMQRICAHISIADDLAILSSGSGERFALAVDVSGGILLTSDSGQEILVPADVWAHIHGINLFALDREVTKESADLFGLVIGIGSTADEAAADAQGHGLSIVRGLNA